MFCLGRHRFNHAKQWTFLISVNCDNFMWFVKFSYVFFRFLLDVLSIRIFVSNSISKWNKSSSPPILCDNINWFFHLKHLRAISSYFRHCLFITINVNMSFLCAVNVCRLNFLKNSNSIDRIPLPRAYELNTFWKYYISFCRCVWSLFFVWTKWQEFLRTHFLRLIKKYSLKINIWICTWAAIFFIMINDCPTHLCF